MAQLVDRFYEQVRQHPALGPVFDTAVKDWAAHKRALTSFWCSVALRNASYRGNPLAKHQPLPIHAAHFADWLALWCDTAREVLPPEPAQSMIDYAQRIAKSLQAGLGLRSHAQPPNLPVAGTYT